MCYFLIRLSFNFRIFLLDQFLLIQFLIVLEFPKNNQISLLKISQVQLPLDQTYTKYREHRSTIKLVFRIIIKNLDCPNQEDNQTKRIGRFKHTCHQASEINLFYINLHELMCLQVVRI
jgi:hypothetical protein